MRILVICRQTQAGQSVKNLRDTWQQHGLIREAASVCEALHLLEEFLPQLILLDVRIPDRKGLGAILSVKAENQSIAIIVLSMHPDLEAEALATGADAFIGKNDPPEKLMEALVAGLCVNKHKEQEHLHLTIRRLPPKGPLQRVSSASRPGWFSQDSDVIKE